jgi:hypothetical protein
MAWKVESMKTQKQKFILLYETGKFSLSSLCRDFGISRPTGYVLVTFFSPYFFPNCNRRKKAIFGAIPALFCKKFPRCVVKKSM